MAPPDTAGELARRAAAQVLLLETPVHTDDSDVLFLLGELLTLGTGMVSFMLNV
jgi:hypothetical protein